MALDFQLVRASLYAWALNVVPAGMPIIFLYPNAPRPTVPYITLYISSVTSVHQDWSYHKSDPNGVITQKGDRQFVLQIQAYGHNATNDPLTVVENIRTSLQKQTTLGTLRANGIAVFNALTINDITELVDSRYERRAQIDILMGIAQTYTDNPGYFDQIEIEQIYSNPAEVIVYDKKITIKA